VIGKRVKLISRGNRMIGLCPFHQEKTPSFHVRDEDGYYHCFGCGVSGDAISFLREQESMSFIDAIHHLAEMAGMTVPEQQKLSPEEREQRNSMAQMLEDAARFFEQALLKDIAIHAKSYLEKRQVSLASQTRYRIGYAPASGLLPFLEELGYKPEDIIAAGLVRRSTRDQSLYDNFRNRLMFPIRNPRGEVIAFGGRALGEDQEPKYLNSADSPMFHKKLVLYGLKEARERIKDGLPVIVSEGYMDAIAIDQYQVAGAVAPLGTALTEEQMMLIWKSTDAPYLCFDGDAAGQRAAARTLLRLLPILEPGKTVRVMRLPKGKDPDDLLKAGGGDALRQIMEASDSFADSLWHTTSMDFDLSKAEQKAKFWQVMRDHIRQINNPAMRDSLGDDIRTRISAMRGQSQPNLNGGKIIGKRHAQSTENLRPSIIMAILLHQPELIHDVHEDLVRLDIKDRLAKKMLNIIAESVTITNHLDESTFRHHLMLAGIKEEDLTSLMDKIKTRIRYDPSQLSLEDAKARLTELISLEIRSLRSRTVTSIRS
jgi:DNA primase